MVDNGLGAFLKNRVVNGLIVFSFKALGRQRNRGQGVFDLMGDAPRHLAPGSHALGLFKLGHVVKDHHQADLNAGVILEGIEIHLKAPGLSRYFHVQGQG